MKTCQSCSQNFEITEEDRNFYHKISPVFSEKRYPTPEPTLCPDCRQQRRLAFRNERNLYHRRCDLSEKSIISIYDENTKFPVFNYQEWWGDEWDCFAYKRTFDFSRNFFYQFLELKNIVPHCNIIAQNLENSDYTNYSMDNKNCYLITSSHQCLDCMYLYRSHHSNDCFDCDNVQESAFCYECSFVENCHELHFSQLCEGCSSSLFLYDCKSCSDCLFSVGLRNKQYYILNKKYSREEFFQKKQEVVKNFSSSIYQLKQIFEKNKLKYPHKAPNNTQCEGCTGDFLLQCKNVENSFFVQNAEDVHFSTDGRDIKSSMDITNPDNLELCYENTSSINNYAVSFSYHVANGSNLFYCDFVMNSKNCFGCVGLKNAEYCILNKQYTKEEYEKLVPKIIEHMQNPSMGSGDSEWGEFFPMSLSPFAYNETVAQEYFSLTKQEISEKNLKWKEEKNSQDYMGPKVEIPDNIADVKDDICQKILQCEVTGKLYKITPQELKFYRKMNLPIPRKCPDQRHKERMALRNPRKLFSRKCDKCNAEISTTYAPERPEKVYCEECYLEEVY